MYRKTPLSRGEKNINVHMLLTFCIRITNYQDFIFTYLAANCIRARAHLPETLLNMFKNPAIIKSGRKLPPDENFRRCSIRTLTINFKNFGPLLKKLPIRSLYGNYIF